jgi:hypothetical protein
MRAFVARRRHHAAPHKQTSIRPITQAPRPISATDIGEQGTGSFSTRTSLHDLDRRTTPTPIGGHRIFFPEASAAGPSETYRDIAATPAQ